MARYDSQFALWQRPNIFPNWLCKSIFIGHLFESCRNYNGNSLLVLIVGAMQLQICPVKEILDSLVLMHRKSKSNYSTYFSILDLHHGA